MIECNWCRAQMASQPVVEDPRAAVSALAGALQHHLCRALAYVPKGDERDAMVDTVLRAMGAFLNPRDILILACLHHGATSTDLRTLADALDSIATQQPALPVVEGA